MDASIRRDSSSISLAPSVPTASVLPSFPTSLPSASAAKVAETVDFSKYAHDLKTALLFNDKLAKTSEQVLAQHKIGPIHDAASSLQGVATKLNLIYQHLFKIQNMGDQIEQQKVEIAQVKENLKAAHSEFLPLAEALTKLKTTEEMIIKEIGNEGEDVPLKAVMQELIGNANLARAFSDEEVSFPLNFSDILKQGPNIVEGTKKYRHTELSSELRDLHEQLDKVESSASEENTAIAAALKADIAKIQKALEEISSKKLTLIIDKELDAIFSSPTVTKNPAFNAARVVNNLLTNAAKYGGPNIQLTANWIAEEGVVKIVIKDNGQGIVRDLSTSTLSPIEINQKAEEILFTQGRQASSDEQSAGSGIGGASLKALVAEFGGDVAVLTKGGGIKEGTEITITLPFTKTETERGIAPTFLPPVKDLPPARFVEKFQKTGTSLIIVDDVQVNTMLAGHMCKKLLQPSKPQRRSMPSAKGSSSMPSLPKKSALPSTKSPLTISPISKRPPVDLSKSVYTFGNKDASLSAAEASEKLMKSLTEIIDRGIEKDTDVICLLDNELNGQALQGEGISDALQEHVRIRNDGRVKEGKPEYTKLFCVSYSSNAPTPKAAKHYDGFIPKELNASIIMGVCVAAWKRNEQTLGTPRTGSEIVGLSPTTPLTPQLGVTSSSSNFSETSPLSGQDVGSLSSFSLGSPSTPAFPASPRTPLSSGRSQSSIGAETPLPTSETPVAETPLPTPETPIAETPVVEKRSLDTSIPLTPSTPVPPNI